MSRKVLVIDDHVASKAALVKTLTEARFDIVGEGSSGKAALKLAQSTAPDAVLMAVGLQDIDGISAAREIMEKNPLPIVLLTSHYDAESVERVKRAGVMAYLIKPLRAEELIPSVELAISRFDEFVALKKENQDLKRTVEARKAIERAKGILMERHGLSESHAFSLIQKQSMKTRKTMVEIAQAIIRSEPVIRKG